MPEQSPMLALDTAVAGEPLGNTYAETEYSLARPEALMQSLGIIAENTGGTRLFVTELHAGAGGPEVLYGAANDVDGELAWQESSAMRRTFPLGVSEADAKTFVSLPFQYVLEAQIPNPLDPNSRFRMHLESEQTVWTATFSDDYEKIVKGSLYGIVTREHVERTPVDFVTCSLACGFNVGFCSVSGNNYLSKVLDCNGAQKDADRDGDGTNDGYRLILNFKSERVATPAD